ncbi:MULTISPECIES: hypothetical protein [unclassified Exiguobacterium]|uniref:hypothetical protein n=1 Tax=unclassified Exiguobacterium TaxID=2644629 RepID=UPI001BE71452|nr:MULTISPECIES: hypothetical protein [unclassified Exiguobacterium]
MKTLVVGCLLTVNAKSLMTQKTQSRMKSRNCVLFMLSASAANFVQTHVFLTEPL